MKQKHQIVADVYAAKEDSEVADRLIRQYLPFIKGETAKVMGRVPREGQDDELSIAMFAFYEAALAYERERGAFLPLAATAIRNRIIDFYRKENRHTGVVSLDGQENGEDDSTLLDQLGHDQIGEHEKRSAAKEEILEFVGVLADYGLSMSDVADNSPRQERTLAACHRALAYAKTHPQLLDALTSTGKLPLKQLAEGSGVERKTLERHRTYMVAILLAYTNGFEIIRGHLRQVAPVKGGVNA